MRLSTAIISLACAFGLASALSLPFDFAGPLPATIEPCPNPTEPYLLNITYLDISPNPPKRGETLTIDAKGILYEDIVEGANINVVVKAGLIKLLTKDFDFCKESINVNKTCPVLAGEQSLNHSVELPKEIPPGKYTVNIKVTNPDKKLVTCLIAKAHFVLIDH
ncbi:Phosphatidylglycerol/phosphatidylinositol transfer protein [Mortierella sp. GBA30]|nr:Phosphatidylglycerol/phosphatidylinositol transfer protein [Mortierella sp. GBA30]